MGESWIACFIVLLFTGNCTEVKVNGEMEEVEVKLEVVSPSSHAVLAESSPYSDIQLRVVVHTPDDHAPVGVSLFNCLAQGQNVEDEGQMVELTDHLGCPVEFSPMGCMVQENDTVVSPVFPLSSLADGGDVTITCSWEVCSSIHDLKCMDRCSFFTHSAHASGHHRMAHLNSQGQLGMGPWNMEEEQRTTHPDNEEQTGMGQSGMEKEEEEILHSQEQHDLPDSMGQREKGVQQDNQEIIGQRYKGVQQDTQEIIGQRDKRDSERHARGGRVSATIRVMPSHRVRPSSGHHHHASGSGHPRNHGRGRSGYLGHHGDRAREGRHHGSHMQDLEHHAAASPGPSTSTVLLYLNPITCSVFLLVIIVFLALYVSFLRSLRASVQTIHSELEAARLKDKFIVRP